MPGERQLEKLQILWLLLRVGTIIDDRRTFMFNFLPHILIYIIHVPIRKWEKELIKFIVYSL